MGKKKKIEKLRELTPEQRQLKAQEIKAKMDNLKCGFLGHVILTFLTVGLWLPFWMLTYLGVEAQKRQMQKELNFLFESAAQKKG